MRTYTFVLLDNEHTFVQGCSLKRIHKHNSNGDTYSAASGSTTYYDDDIISCSDDSTAGDGMRYVRYLDELLIFPGPLLMLLPSL